MYVYSSVAKRMLITYTHIRALLSVIERARGFLIYTLTYTYIHTFVLPSFTQCDNA